MNKKVIEYYRTNCYGKTMEYIVNQGDANIVRQLTGKKTIDSATRELLRDLMGGTNSLEFKEVLAPTPAIGNKV